MNLRGRIHVEPLDDERLTNIERKLVVAVSEMRAPAARAPRRVLALAGVAAAIVVAGFVGWTLRGNAGGGAPADAVETFALNTDDGHTIQLGNAEFGDIALTSGAATDLRVERTRDRVIIDMHRGSIAMAVEHKPGRLLVVRAGETEIEDVGTRFSVDYDGKDKLEVRVTEGEVTVKRGGKHEDITAGFAWALDIGTVVTLAELDARRGPQVIGMIDPDVSGDGLPPVADPLASPDSGDRGGGTDGASVSGPTSGEQAARPGAGKRSAVKKPGIPNARKALLTASIDPPEDVGTTDPRRAIAAYLERAKTMQEGEDKARLLYSMAYVQHMAKNDEAAKYTLRGLLRRNGGPAFRSALWLNVRIHCIEAFDDDCRKAAELYRRKFPDGLHTGVADEIVREIARR